MEKHLKNHAVIGFCALGLIGLNSCLQVDDTYDLDKDFDMTINVGGNLTIPGSSTEKMMLDDLLDLEDDGVIVADENGDYKLVQKGEKTTTDVSVPSVEVDMTQGFEGAEHNFNIPDNDLEYSKDIRFDKDIKIEVVQEGITSDIKELMNAETECKETYITFSKEGGEFAKAVLKDGYSIGFPDYITVKSESPDWIAEGSRLTLSKADGVEITENTNVKFQITYVNFVNTDAKFTYNDAEKDNSSIHLKGSISLDGDINVSSNGGQGGSAAIIADVKSESMSIKTVTAKVDPKVDITIDPIELNDMPDFLTDNDVMLDLTDPRIYITVTNPSPVTVNLGATLKSSKTGKEDKTVTISGVEIPKEETGYKICINQLRDGYDINENVDYVMVEGLSTIIQNIPDKIEMTDIETSVKDEAIKINLAENFVIETDYNIETPLKFGPETYIKYNETIDGWDADLEDMEFNTVKGSMTIVNEIPLGISLTAEAIDVNGNVMENVTVDLNVSIEPGSEGNPSTKEATFSITTDDGSIKGLDGINIVVEARTNESTSGVSLNENQSLQLLDVKLGLEGGITMDLN